MGQDCRQGIASGVQAAVNGGNLVDDVTPPRRRLAAVAFLDGIDGVDKIDRIDSGQD